MVELVEQCIPNKPYTQPEIEDFIGEKISNFIQDVIQWEDVLKINKYFYPFQRAVHVFSESDRVLQFREVCLNSQLTDKQKCQQLGKLMDESHYSCDQLYNCSSKELETLTKICRKYGAMGSRLTGAGWGGCSISIIKEENEKLFMENVINEYYQPLLD